MTIRPARAALAVNRTLPVSPIGGTAPYTYSVVSGGAGGIIDSEGLYTAPAVVGADTIRIVDSSAPPLSATARVMIATPLELFCDIIQTGLGLADGRVYIWNQKINSPSDQGLWVAVSVLTEKPFSNTNINNPTTNKQEQTINVHAMLSLDIVSKDRSAFDRKEEVLMAVNSQYSRNQQALNAFKIFTLSDKIVNLSEIDGAAIPYRFNTSIGIQYVVTKKTAADYYSSFEAVETETEA